MIFSMTGQEKDDLLIQVTAWTGLIVYELYALLVRCNKYPKYIHKKVTMHNKMYSNVSKVFLHSNISLYISYKTMI